MVTQVAMPSQLRTRRRRRRSAVLIAFLTVVGAIPCALWIRNAMQHRDHVVAALDPTVVTFSPPLPTLVPPTASLVVPDGGTGVQDGRIAFAAMLPVERGSHVASDQPRITSHDYSFVNRDALTCSVNYVEIPDEITATPAELASSLADGTADFNHTTYEVPVTIPTRQGQGFGFRLSGTDLRVLVYQDVAVVFITEPVEPCRAAFFAAWESLMVDGVYVT